MRLVPCKFVYKHVNVNISEDVILNAHRCQVTEFITIRSAKVNKVKTFLPFSKLMKRPQAKFHAHVIREYQIYWVNIYHQVKIHRWVKLFLQHCFFLFIDILLKLQQQILISFCKFCCNSVIIMGFLRFLT